MTMNPDIKAQWVAALRSGDYKQGKYALHNMDTDSYCCLGVLCHLAVKAGVVGEGNVEYNPHADSDIEVYGADGEARGAGGVVLPSEVMAWAELDDNSPDVYIEDDDGDEGPQGLTELNDDMEYSFDQLADLIEEQL